MTTAHRVPVWLLVIALATLGLVGPATADDTTWPHAPVRSALDGQSTAASEATASLGARPAPSDAPRSLELDSRHCLAQGATDKHCTPLRSADGETPSGQPSSESGRRALSRGGSALISGAGVAAKTADDWPVLSGIVRDAARGKGNYGLGSGTASQATRAGESWVGEGYRIASDGKTLVSRDGLRTFRPPTWKPNEGKYQANFEYWIGVREGKPFGNGHLDITDMVP